MNNLVFFLLVRTVKTDYLLIGKIYCGYCGVRLTAEACNSRNGIATRYYKCSTFKRRKGKCVSKSIRKEKLEDFAATKIKSALLKGIH